MARALATCFDGLKIDGNSEQPLSTLTDISKSYVKEGKVMFILRGAPGTGKSTIVKKIMSEFDTKYSCSADDYFSRNGSYQFDRTKISEAHAHSKDKAEKFCQEGRKVVIIDNTHIKTWEFRPYRQLAQKYGYIVFIIVPSAQFNTPPDILARRNKHGVDAATISRKLKDFEEAVPFFYGWFFNLPNHVTINLIRKKAFEIHLKYKGRVPDFSHPELYHVTSIYLGKNGKGIQRLDEHVGRVDDLSVVAVVITQKTAAAIVKPSEEAFNFYDNDQLDDSDLGRGHAAHITLGCVEGTSNVEARNASILAKQCSKDRSRKKVVMEEGLMVHYPDDRLSIINVTCNLKGIFSFYPY